MIALLLVGCAEYDSGASEPVVVRDGAFFEGELPEDPSATSPILQYVASTGYIITQGWGSIQYSGLVTEDAYSVAVAMPDVGTGYWVVPVDGVDPTQGGNRLFGLTLDFTRDVPYGLTTVGFTALDGDAHPGPRYDATLCVLPDFSDNNYASCDADTPPQHTILSLRWDTDVDLDLIVVTPTGKVVRPGSPSTLVDDDDESTPGVLTRDSNNGCDIDGVRLESLVFEDEPPAGEYAFYASLNAACGEPAVNFELTRYTRAGSEEEGWTVDAEPLASGALLGSQADGGASLGTHLATVSLP